MGDQAMKATVSGSFRRAMGEIEEAVYALTDAGVRILSPADPRVVDQFGDFLFVASDKVRAIRLVQSRHLAAIAASDFVWLVAPDGYIGQSGAMEVGYAAAVGTPVFCSEVPADLTLRQYMTTMPTPQAAALEIARRAERESSVARSGNVLLDPVETMQGAHDDLEAIALELSRPRRGAADTAAKAAERLHDDVIRPLRFP